MTVMVARSAKSTGQQWLFRLPGCAKTFTLRIAKRCLSAE